MKMNTILDQLLDLLKQQTELYQSMLIVLEKEKEAVIQSELNALTDAGKKKDHILRTLRSLEIQRMQLVTELAQALGCPPGDLTLTAISHLVDGPYDDRIRQAGADFSKLLARLQQTNRRNQQLIEHSLVLLRGSFNLLNELTASGPVYYRTGDLKNSNPTGKLLRGEI